MEALNLDRTLISIKKICNYNLKICLLQYFTNIEIFIGRKLGEIFVFGGHRHVNNTLQTYTKSFAAD